MADTTEKVLCSFWVLVRSRFWIGSPGFISKTKTTLTNVNYFSFFEVGFVLCICVILNSYSRTPVPDHPWDHDQAIG